VYDESVHFENTDLTSKSSKCGDGNMEQCFGKDHHMALCDTCGLFTSAMHGCDNCDKNQPRINIKMLEKLNPSINGMKLWQEYTMVHKLLFNQATWEHDLDKHMLFLRRKHWRAVATSKLPENQVSCRESLGAPKKNRVDFSLGVSIP
jgi:hypothetical protein